ncbi:MAG: hypothetical protein MAG795_00049 [Candidatus Woesearchaeota archaeon]|nr:hypothetical protein [Candidatus Woesearchaeota archaeon]
MFLVVRSYENILFSPTSSYIKKTNSGIDSVSKLASSSTLEITLFTILLPCFDRYILSRLFSNSSSTDFFVICKYLANLTVSAADMSFL